MLHENVKKGAEILRKALGTWGENPLRELQSREILELLTKAPEHREIVAALKHLGVPPTSHRSEKPLTVVKDERGNVKLAYRALYHTPAKLRALEEHERQHIEDYKAGKPMLPYYVGEVRGALREIAALVALGKRGELARADVGEAIEDIIRRGLAMRTFRDLLYATLPLYLIGREGRIPEPESIGEEHVREPFRMLVKELAREIAEEKDSKRFGELLDSLLEVGVLKKEDSDILEYVEELGRRMGYNKERIEEIGAYREAQALAEKLSSSGDRR